MKKKYRKRIGKGKMRIGRYIGVSAPNHPLANAKGFVMEHRIIMESKLKRHLYPNEKVHHIDGNPTNNDIKNLVVITQRQHSRIHKNPATKWELLENPRWLKKQFSDLNKTPTYIAKELGCSHQAVRFALDRFGLRPIPKGKPRPPIKYPELHDDNWLKEKSKIMSQKDIASFLGCNQSMVCRYQQKHNITERMKHPPAKTKFSELKNKSWLESKAKTMSQKQIADLLGCDRSLVSQSMCSFGIKSIFKNQYSHAG